MRIKRRLLGALVYGLTTLALWNWFDALDGMDTGDHAWFLKHHPFPRLAVYGTIGFAIATLISFVAPRVAIWTAAAACLLSWPYWILEAPVVPWGRMSSLPQAVINAPSLPAILVFAFATVYTLFGLKPRSQLSAN